MKNVQHVSTGWRGGGGAILNKSKKEGVALHTKALWLKGVTGLPDNLHIQAFYEQKGCS